MIFPAVAVKDAVSATVYEGAKKPLSDFTGPEKVVCAIVSS
jgi:hypothetical protein